MYDVKKSLRVYNLVYHPLWKPLNISFVDVVRNKLFDVSTFQRYPCIRLKNVTLSAENHRNVTLSEEICSRKHYITHKYYFKNI